MVPPAISLCGIAERSFGLAVLLLVTAQLRRYATMLSPGLRTRKNQRALASVNIEMIAEPAARAALIPKLPVIKPIIGPKAANASLITKLRTESTVARYSARQ